MKNFGFPVKADGKEVDVLDGEGVDVRLEGAQEGGEVQKRGLNKCLSFERSPYCHICRAHCFHNHHNH